MIEAATTISLLVVTPIRRVALGVIERTHYASAITWDHPIVRAFGESQERILPPIDVIDWWEHPGEEGRTTLSGLVGVARQLIVTTERILVVKEASIERSVAMGSIGGAKLYGPAAWPVEDSDRAVLVTSGGEAPTVWGCWSASKDEARSLMSDIFFFTHGQPTGL